MKRLTPFFTAIRNNVAAFLCFLLFWTVASLFFPAYVIPPPQTVFQQAPAYLQARFFQHLGLTMYRVTVGFLGAFVLGSLAGIAAAGLHKIQHLNTLLVLFQVIPGTILGIIFLLVFGVGSQAPIALVAFLTLPVVAINTSNSLSKRNIQLEHYVRSVGGRNIHLARYVYLPLLIPTLQSNLTLGFSLSLKVVLLGEFIGSQHGIGYLLNVSKIHFNMDAVFFYLFVVLLLMVCFQIGQHVLFSIFLGKYFYPE